MILPIGSVYTDNFHALRNLYQQPRHRLPRVLSPPKSQGYVQDILDLSPEAQLVINSNKKVGIN